MKGCWIATIIVMEGTACICHAREAHQLPSYAQAETNVAPSDLVVTGEKIYRPLQDTPASVSIATDRSMAEQNLDDVYDVLDHIPNVAVDGTRTSFSIRGIDAFNVSGGGDAPLSALYIDGVAIPRLAMAAGPFDLLDISQIEIFRGPQSTIQGRNALAGAVIVNTSEPGFDWTAKSGLRLSDENGARQAGLAVGGPMIRDLLAFRLAAQASRASGLIRNITRKEPGDRQGSETLRGKLLMTPVLLPGLGVTATFLYDRHRRGTFYTELDPPYALRDRLTTADAQDRKQGASLIGNMAVRYEISPEISLVSASSYSRIGFRSTSDADRTKAEGQVSRLQDDYRTFQQEVRVTLDAPWANGVIGAYYLRERRNYHYSATQGLSLESLGVGLQLRSTGLPPATADAVLDLYGRMLPIENSSSLRRLTHNAAAFGDLTFPLNSRLQLRAGLRYDAETQDRRANQAVTISQSLPSSADLAVPAFAPIVDRLNGLLYAMAQGASHAEPSARVTYHVWLPRLGATYTAAKGVALSVTIQRGYRAGGVGFNEQRAQSYSFAPEYVTNYEGALRSTWFSDRLFLNANIYRMDWEGQQVPIQLTPGSVYDTQIVNIGKSRLHGFEIEARALVSGNVSVYSGVGFGKARFAAFKLPPGSLAADAQGKAFPRSPRWTVAAGATLSAPRGIFANVNVNHRSGYYQTVTDQSSRDIAALTLVDAKLGWRWHNFGAFVAVSNIFDVQEPNQFFRDIDGRRRGTLTDPRIVTLTLESQI